MFYTQIEMFVYNLMLPFHKIWDITVKKDRESLPRSFFVLCFPWNEKYLILFYKKHFIFDKNALYLISAAFFCFYIMICSPR